MRTFRSSRSCTVTPDHISVQAQIDRIEECEQHHNAQSLNNMLYSTAGTDSTSYEPSDLPDGINPNSIKCSNCRNTEDELISVQNRSGVTSYITSYHISILNSHLLRKVYFICHFRIQKCHTLPLKNQCSTNQNL